LRQVVQAVCTICATPPHNLCKAPAQTVQPHPHNLCSTVCTKTKTHRTMMKLSLIRTDNKQLRYLSTQLVTSFMTYLQSHPRKDGVKELRTLLKYIDDPTAHPDAAKRLPRVYPSEELMRNEDGTFVMKHFNGLLLLSVGGLRDEDEVERVKRAVRTLPSTLAAFTGSSGHSVKLLVRVARIDGSLPVGETEAEHFCQKAYPVAVTLYEALLGRSLGPTAMIVGSSFRLTFDPSPYHNPQAAPLLIDEAEAHQPLQPVVGDEAAEADEKTGRETRQLIQFIGEHYELRHNTMMGYTEFLPKKRMAIGWQPVDERVLNSIAMEARLAGLNVWDKDVSRYVRSNMVRQFNPIESYLWSLHGRWDGKDHIGRLIRTVPTNQTHWPQWFRRWLLAMVAQWLGRNGQYGNSVVPLLISNQGYNKSTFCRSLIPQELQWGYTDSLQLQDKRQVLQQMGQMLLINLDEFNQISPAVQQGFLKNIIQLPNVKVKRPYGRHVEEQPRMASFIATTNVADVLADPTGSRRFIGIELKGPIDVSVKPNHEQLYAQAMQLLLGGERYWFDEDETRELMQNNLNFQYRTPAEQLFMEYFQPAANEQEGRYMTAAAIYAELRRLAGAILKPSGINGFGRLLTSIPGLRHKRTMQGTQYLVKIKAEIS